jgi:hypothetical protein
MNVKRLFTQHPHAVGESYGEHMKAALTFAGPLAGAALAALIHAFLPFLFATTASGTIRRLHARMVNRVPKAPLQEASASEASGMPAWDPVI